MSKILTRKIQAVQADIQRWNAQITETREAHESLKLRCGERSTAPKPSGHCNGSSWQDIEAALGDIQADLQLS